MQLILHNIAMLSHTVLRNFIPVNRIANKFFRTQYFLPNKTQI